MGARKLAGALASIAALTIAIVPASAFAQGSSANAYGGVGGQVQSEVDDEGVGGAGGGGSGPAAAQSSGTGALIAGVSGRRASQQT